MTGNNGIGICDLKEIESRKYSIPTEAFSKYKIYGFSDGHKNGPSYDKIQQVIFLNNLGQTLERRYPQNSVLQRSSFYIQRNKLACED